MYTIIKGKAIDDEFNLSFDKNYWLKCLITLSLNQDEVKVYKVVKSTNERTCL